MRTIFAITLVLLSLTMTSCSWITEFAIANYSDAPITVTYKAKYVKDRYSGEMRCIMLETPAMVPATSFRKRSERNWRELTQDEFKSNTADCSISIVLPPDMAVRIARFGSYAGHRSDVYQYFELEALTLQSPSGLIHYEGAEVLYGFKKVNNGLYVLNYE